MLGSCVSMTNVDPLLRSVEARIEFGDVAGVVLDFDADVVAVVGERFDGDFPQSEAIVRQAADAADRVADVGCIGCRRRPGRRARRWQRCGPWTPTGAMP